MEELREENARLEAQLFHLKSILLPSKANENEMLVNELATYMHRLQMKEQELKSVAEERDLYKGKWSTMEGLVRGQPKEVETLKQELADKNHQLEIQQELNSDLQAQLQISEANYKNDMSAAYDTIQEKEAELNVAREENKKLVAEKNSTLKNKQRDLDGYKKKVEKNIKTVIALNMQLLNGTKIDSIDCRNIKIPHRGGVGDEDGGKKGMKKGALQAVARKPSTASSTFGISKRSASRVEKDANHDGDGDDSKKQRGKPQ